MTNYSIIIPHKNCITLLDRCLRSIPEREDIQVVVVDDQSDNLGELRSLEVKYKHLAPIFIYSNSGKGAGAARNEGLLKSIGNWLIFADADDYFSENAFKVYDEYLDSDYDVIYFKHASVYSDTLKECVRFEERNERINSFLNKSTITNEQRLRYKDAVPWCKMIRRSIVVTNDIRFDEVPASNDVMFAAKCGFAARKVVADRREVYVVTYRRDSLTTTPSRTNLKSRFEVMLRFNTFMKEIGCPHLQGRPLFPIIQAFRYFGAKEGCSYIQLVKEYNISIFTGLGKVFSSFIPKVRQMFNKNYHKF